MSAPAQIKTFRPDNQFSVVCPVFGVTTEIRKCITLRDKQYRGERVDVRRGCQACISASKCPIVRLVKHIDEHSDVYYSPTPKSGAFSQDLLAAVAPVSVPDHIMKRFEGMSAAERSAILATNGILHASESTSAPASKPKSTPASKPAGAPAPMDYAAAINEEMKGAK